MVTGLSISKAVWGGESGLSLDGFHVGRIHFVSRKNRLSDLVNVSEKNLMTHC
jgi:hypothetical protein